MSGPTANVGSTLTDGTGISALTGSKVLKDFVADFLMTAAGALVAVNVTGVDQAVANPAVVTTAIIGALIRVGYRAILKWATS